MLVKGTDGHAWSVMDERSPRTDCFELTRTVTSGFDSWSLLLSLKRKICRSKSRMERGRLKQIVSQYFDKFVPRSLIFYEIYNILSSTLSHILFYI